MAVRKQRATTTETYALDKDYSKVLSKAKKLHRLDNEFYIGIMSSYYTSISTYDFNAYNYNKEELEHWIFANKRWIKQ